MAWWQWLLDAAGLLLLMAALPVLSLAVRRRVLSRHGGTFELSHRVRTSKAGRGWVLGIGRYSGDRLEWFRIFSLAPRPKRMWDRADLVYERTRELERGEESAIYPGHVIVECRAQDGPLELAMSPASLTGFQAWLEARPPGTDWSRN